MTDSRLDLPFDTEVLGARSARHRQRQRRRRERRRNLLALVVVLAVFVGIGGGVWWGVDRVGSFFATEDFPGPGTGDVTVEIKQGDSATAIGNTLERAGVVKSADAFVEAAEAEAGSRNLQPGFYRVRREMRGADALALLLDPSSRVISRFTIPEGLTVKTVLARVAEQTGLPLAELTAASRNPAALGVPAWGGGTLEGFLFPDTYELPPNATAAGVLRSMVARMNAELAEIGFVARAEATGLKPREALVIASLVEGEAIPADFAKVSRVVYNRLAADMPLQYDSTTNYGRELKGQPKKERLSAVELNDPTNPYSTHARRGLPPGPIANPGTAALTAATAPEPGPWLYFVKIDKSGRSAFARTLAEHEANIRTAKANGAF